MDKSVKPGDDFFRYADGKWYDQAVIPPERASVGSFALLNIQSEDKLRGILESLQTQTDLNAEQIKVRDLYRSYVDVDRIEALGLKPAAADLKKIAGLKTYDDVARTMGSVPLGTQSLFGAFIAVDNKNPNAYAVFVTQSGLGLPDRDYYLISEKGSVAAREGYHVFIETMLKLASIADAKKKSDRIFALETEIAKLHWPAADRRDADKTYNPMKVSELEQLRAAVPLGRPFCRNSASRETKGAERTLVVREKSAFPELAKLFDATPVATWRDYLTFHYLRYHSDVSAQAI